MTALRCSCSTTSWARARKTTTRRTRISARPLAPVTLHGAIVRLEPLAPRHTPVLAAIGTAPELWQFTMTHIAGYADAEAYVDAALQGAAQGTALPFVTVLQQGDRVIGSTRFAHYDREARRVEIGWTWVAPPWQRTGANVEAKLLMMRHAFEQLGCNRVEYKTDVLNQKSRNALLGIGAQEEGVLREHCVTWSGRVRDTIYYSVLAREWPSVQQRLEQRLLTHRAARSDPTIPAG